MRQRRFRRYFVRVHDVAVWIRYTAKIKLRILSKNYSLHYWYNFSRYGTHDSAAYRNVASLTTFVTVHNRSFRYYFTVKTDQNFESAVRIVEFQPFDERGPGTVFSRLRTQRGGSHDAFSQYWSQGARKHWHFCFLALNSWKSTCLDCWAAQWSKLN